MTGGLLAAAAWFTPDANYYRPAYGSCLSGLTPCTAKGIEYLLQRIAAFGGDESLSRRPRSEVAQQMIEIPVRRHLESRCVNLVEREGEICELLHEPALWWPERPDHFVIISVHNLIDCLLDVQQIVS